MRLGGPAFTSTHEPGEWVAYLRTQGYRAAYCPVTTQDDAPTRRAFRQAAQDAGIVVAEVGAWSNPLSPDDATRTAAIRYCQDQLALADEMGANCCVNIAGSRGGRWDGPSPLDLAPETFEMVVETTRQIIDAVKPAHTFYTLETMPWMYPDSVESYTALFNAIDRSRFAVHLDPVNLVCSPQRYFNTAALLNAFFEHLGQHIRSCHAKDVLLADRLTTNLDEVIPGKGGMDYPLFLKLAHQCSPDLPVMLEHLQGEADYQQAAAFVRQAAADAGVPL